MNQTEKEIDSLYENCGIPKDLEYPVSTNLNRGKLNNSLKSDKRALNKSSVFSYSAYGASRGRGDRLNKNGYNN